MCGIWISWSEALEHGECSHVDPDAWPCPGQGALCVVMDSPVSDPKPQWTGACGWRHGRKAPGRSLPWAQLGTAPLPALLPPRLVPWLGSADLGVGPHQRQPGHSCSH